MNKLTNLECNRLGLPGRSPVEPFEALDWYPWTEETPDCCRPESKSRFETTLAQNVSTSTLFETAAAILGDGKAAA